jgi:hypothetical protein
MNAFAIPNSFASRATAYDDGWHFNVSYEHSTSLLSLPHMVSSAEPKKVVTPYFFSQVFFACLHVLPAI